MEEMEQHMVPANSFDRWVCSLELSALHSKLQRVGDRWRDRGASRRIGCIIYGEL
jgi:hypothetical protein